MHRQTTRQIWRNISFMKKKLNETLVNIGMTREIILLGDFNGHTGTKVNNQIVGPYGETRINDNGERLIDLCESHNLRITNGYFKHKRYINIRGNNLHEI